MIDTHAHLFLCTRSAEEIIQAALDTNITHIIIPGTNLETSKQAIELAKSHDILYATAGIYPGQVQDQDKLDELEHIINTEPIVAIGEIGLDYFRVTTPKETQISMFKAQLDLARQYSLPVIIHNRHTEDDMIEVVKNYEDVKKVFHCFGSNQAFIDATLSENTYYSFTGTVTYAKKGKTINAVKNIPLEKIMIETDCPYLSPGIHKGKENQPAYVLETAKRIAEIKELPLKTVIESTTKTAKSFFNLQKN
jgi:TatD DNase family protein